MKKLTPEEKQAVLEAISAGIEKACAEGQPVRELAEAAAQGRQIEYAFVTGTDGCERFVLSVAED